MPQAGQVNTQFGVYKCLCCGAEIVLNAGSTFPDCPNHPKLTTIWRPVLDEKITRLIGKKAVSAPARELHIENRRLFDLVFGRLKLEQWEQNHLHGCKVCQGMLYVFIQQPPIAVAENPEKPGDAA